MVFLALIGLFVIIWWVSKIMKKISNGLFSVGVVLADLAAYCNKKSLVNNNRVTRQNINVEEKLHNITGEVSNVSYNQKVRDEIDGIIQNLPPISPRAPR